MEINNTAIPTNMDSAAMLGGYNFHPAKIAGYNGQKEPIFIGNPWAEWHFDEMSDADWDWWTQTIMGGDNSLILTQALLVDDDKNETEYTRGVLYKPVRGHFEPGKHMDVVIKLVDLS